MDTLNEAIPQRTIHMEFAKATVMDSDKRWVFDAGKLPQSTNLEVFADQTRIVCIPPIDHVAG